ncbi:hypothetical protein [Neisseria weixii]|uniref:hypothetical protein n=1 Tax=Neisseria weixii TaxID=1853276 RepID=UPI0012FE37D2
MTSSIFPTTLEHECNYFEPLPQDMAEGTKIYAGKGYGGKANRILLQRKRLSDGIMRKAHRGRPLTEEESAKK